MDIEIIYCCFVFDFPDCLQLKSSCYVKNIMTNWRVIKDVEGTICVRNYLDVRRKYLCNLRSLLNLDVSKYLLTWMKHIVKNEDSNGWWFSYSNCLFVLLDMFLNNLMLCLSSKLTIAFDILYMLRSKSVIVPFDTLKSQDNSHWASN